MSFSVRWIGATTHFKIHINRVGFDQLNPIWFCFVKVCYVGFFLRLSISRLCASLFFKCFLSKFVLLDLIVSSTAYWDLSCGFNCKFRSCHFVHVFIVSIATYSEVLPYFSRFIWNTLGLFLMVFTTLGRASLLCVSISWIVIWLGFFLLHPSFLQLTNWFSSRRRSFPYELMSGRGSPLSWLGRLVHKEIPSFCWYSFLWAHRLSCWNIKLLGW